jgi:type IV secretory pathway VirD2 relaxase
VESALWDERRNIPMGRKGCFVPMAHSQSQRCIVKGSIIRYGREYLHYMTREGIGIDGREPKLFGTLDREQFIQHSSQRYFVWIVSPEHGNELDMPAYTQSLMKRVATDLRLDNPAWIATAHYNTAHPHSHVILQGRELNGAGFEIDNEYLRNGILNEARDLATRELGPQHNFDWQYEQTIERTLQHEYSRFHERTMDLLRDWKQKRAHSHVHDISRTLHHGQSQDRTTTHTRQPEQDRGYDIGW